MFNQRVIKAEMDVDISYFRKKLTDNKMIDQMGIYYENFLNKSGDECKLYSEYELNYLKKINLENIKDGKIYLANNFYSKSDMIYMIKDINLENDFIVYRNKFVRELVYYLL